MRLSLSTNWCNRRIESGEEIADKALELGFRELELGYHTTLLQVKGFKARLDRIPVGSVHAFCPVPISAPQGYPELYSLASFDEEDRKMAKLQITRNIRFAADMGADTVVLHAGRVSFASFFSRIDTQALRDVFRKYGNDIGAPRYVRVLRRAEKRRRQRGQRQLDIFMRELAAIVPELEKNKVTLALENLPYYEGFPAEWELAAVLASELKGAPVRGWFDTGHDRVRRMHGWMSETWADQKAAAANYAGMHLNDVEAFTDDHFAPGDGQVDFAALRTFAENVRHVVFEPNSSVTEEELRKGVAHIRRLWDVV